MKYLGNRIVKTAVAVFLTAAICNLIGWPPVFAVITAIVTLEPTVSDSIKKGLVRFPASAIGSFYAVLFISLFGNSPITYTLAATLTIFTCYRLKLHAGLLVATITAVAMVEVVYDNYLLSFFIRLGTTTIGLVVSTLVNFLIFPPDYMKVIRGNLQSIYEGLGKALYNITERDKEIQLEQIVKRLDKTEELIRYQQEESRYHPLIKDEKDSFEAAKKELNHLRFIHYHLSNINNVNVEKINLKQENWGLVIEAVEGLAKHMTAEDSSELLDHELNLRNLMDLFWRSSHSADENDISELPQELILLYELINIFHLVKQLDKSDSASFPQASE